MNNCEIYGFKHKLKIVGAVDQFIFGWVYFECANCKSRLQVDCPTLYRALQTPREQRDPWR